MEILIPARTNAPETKLYIEILKKNTSLGSRQVTLMVPGGPGGNHCVYDSIRNDLLELSDLILFDPRGCGYSEHSSPEFCSLNHYINDIDAIRQYFNLKKINLMGGSYGAIASLGYAIRYKENIKKLLLIAGSPSYRFIETAKNNLRKQGTLEQIKAAEDLWNGTFKNAQHFNEYYKIMSSLYICNKNNGNELPPTTKPNIPYNIEITNYGFSHFLRDFDFESFLPDILCETLILSGKNDWINDSSHAALMANRIPNSELIIFENCGHFIWEDQRNKFMKAVIKFFSEKGGY
jgi:proline iminopeptidase